MKRKGCNRVIVSVTNDLSTDQRVKKVCHSLQKLGYDILLVGRQLPDSIKLSRPYTCKRMKLIFNKGALFYTEYNLRLFLLLLFSRVSIFHSNDLDTLLANYLAAKIRNKPLVYDTHEYFTGVPEIQDKPFVKSVWTSIEKWIFPKLNHIITVNYSIANLYNELYGKQLRVIRNMPQIENVEKWHSKKELGLPTNKPIIITQGAGINRDRGIEEAVEAMQYLPHVLFLIIGNGDRIPYLKQSVKKHGLEESVIFKPRMPYAEMMHYTHHAKLGLTLDKDTNINYRFSLPNKLFDYIHAGVPVLATRVTEVEKIVTKYNIGLFVENHTPKHIASKIEKALTDQNIRAEWTTNLPIAAKELHWEHEQKQLEKIYAEFE